MSTFPSRGIRELIEADIANAPGQLVKVID